MVAVKPHNFRQWGLIGLAAVFLLVMLVLPLILVASEALAKGWQVYLDALNEPFARKALFLTLEATVAAVLGNTVFGLASAWLLTKYDFRGKAFWSSLLDLPFAISPVVAGLLFVILFGRMSPIYPFLRAEHIAIIFAVPGIILATVFVTFPFITRELVPIMEAQGRSEEEAAATMGASGWTIFRRVTLPNIKWALIYGVILCTARALGEFGAVSVVSGHIRGKTNTLPLHIEILYNEYNFTAAFAVASILVILAVVILILRNLVEWRAKRGLRNGN
ncbi:sulfate ABC transporter permease subunit CysW [Selenomonas ruminis]|uniref:Sulfate ABC transporter permease subunit CysW n=1 Tax=Selenomonas ruminis TaxID=2593411 RepID=A0A5D6W8R9_9FIRM|nr:sulfate ABC transporter permease subunit CysW [Selenomonas sp. mPRGC5]TYZ23349.1 sulfate ABC transporter permease subunit CysW [Selenomonas sp. mPRGC5]